MERVAQVFRSHEEADRATREYYRSLTPAQRLDILLEKNREGTLTAEETAELGTFERFEHLVRLLKARVLQKQGT